MPKGQNKKNNNYRSIRVCLIEEIPLRVDLETHKMSYTGLAGQEIKKATFVTATIKMPLYSYYVPRDWEQEYSQ